MSVLKSRLSKLEQFSRSSPDERTKDERDAQYAAFVDQVSAVAAVCTSVDDVIAYLKTLDEPTDGAVVSLDDRQRADGMRARFARMVWDDVHGTRPLLAG